MAEAHPTEDEYKWEHYTQEYSDQVDQMEAAPHQGSDFLVKKWAVTKGGIVFYDNLHGNWTGIYNKIYKLQPKSVFECGCGGMYHLKNIKTLFPKIDVAACDLLASQIKFGAKKFSVSEDLLEHVTVRDFSAEDATEGLDTYDFVYSHAVIMHISGDKAPQFLKNMLAISNKHVFLIEGDQHDYPALLEEIGESDNWTVSSDITSRFLFTKIDKPKVSTKKVKNKKKVQK